MRKFLLMTLLLSGAFAAGACAQAIAPKLPPDYYAIEAPWYYRIWYSEVEQCVRTLTPDLYTEDSSFENIRWYKVPGIGWNSVAHQTWIEGAYYDYNETIYVADGLTSEDEKELVKHEIMHYLLRRTDVTWAPMYPDINWKDPDHPRPPYTRCEWM